MSEAETIAITFAPDEFCRAISMSALKRSAHAQRDQAGVRELTHLDVLRTCLLGDMAAPTDDTIEPSSRAIQIVKSSLGWRKSWTTPAKSDGCQKCQPTSREVAPGST